MFLNAQNQCVALLLASGLVAAATPADAGEPLWDEGNTIANGRFESNGKSGLPDGWEVIAPNKALGWSDALCSRPAPRAPDVACPT